jgi:pimeloyl-ACP methyl ester carboxylesterase
MSQPVRAWVHCGAQQTAYARAGSGPAVMVLTRNNAEASTPWFELARSFRVILPDLEQPCGCKPDGPDWLTDFFDALGLPRASLVADEHYALPALHFALTAPERIASITLLRKDESGQGSFEPLTDVLAGRGLPMLLLPLTTAEPLSAQLSLLIAFLTGI